MSTSPLSFFFTNYDFKNFHATNADMGFIENHASKHYAKDELPIVNAVRKYARTVSNNSVVHTDYYFDAGEHDGMYRRLEGFHVKLIEKTVMKVTINMGEEEGSYTDSTAAQHQMQAFADKHKGYRWQTHDTHSQEKTLDYMYCFTLTRYLVSELGTKAVFSVKEDSLGLTVTIMPLTDGLSELSQGNTESTGMFVQIRLVPPNLQVQ